LRSRTHFEKKIEQLLSLLMGLVVDRCRPFFPEKNREWKLPVAGTRALADGQTLGPLIPLQAKTVFII